MFMAATPCSSVLGFSNINMTTTTTTITTTPSTRFSTAITHLPIVTTAYNSTEVAHTGGSADVHRYVCPLFKFYLYLQLPLTDIHPFSWVGLHGPPEFYVASLCMCGMQNPSYIM